MATGNDVRDMLGLDPSAPRPVAKKKKKLIEPQPRVSGFKREVAALMGDSVPPINIVEQKQYKAKAPLNKLFKTRHWETREFAHGGRKDGLVLTHWKRAIPSAARGPPISTQDVDLDGKESTPVTAEVRFEDEFPSEKWNVEVSVPTYTDEQYDNNLKSEDWTREETDYLLELCHDFDLRWVLIADRYDPTSIGDYPPRAMEAMKLRYYTIAAKMMETHTPASTMTQSEFQLWEKMRNFDAKTETLRKSMAEKLFERTKEEADEERILLEELNRITKNEEEFIKLRRDLYSRLEPVLALRRTERGEEQSTAMYQTSAGLTALLQSLLQKEKRLKRPTLPNGEPAQLTPVDQRRGQPNQYSNRRDTMESQPDRPQKKGSVSLPNVRTLSAVEEAKYGVTHAGPGDRFTSGVQFRHQKVDRLVMAKSATQTSKIQAALTQLGIPARLLMPTERICREFETLIHDINDLLDVRKGYEKITNELKVLEEMKRIRLGLPKPGEDDAMEIDTSQVQEPKDDAVNESTLVDDQDAEGEDDADGEKDEVDESIQVDQDEDDAEGEDDEDAGEKSAVAEDDEDEVDQSYGDLGKDAEDEEDEEEQDDDDDDRPTLGQDLDDEEDDNEDADPEDVIEEEDGDAEVDESEAADQSDEEEAENEDEAEEQNEVEDDDDPEAEAEAEVEASEPEPSRPSSAHSATRPHKRSASVISDASRTGSNRSGLGRKKRR